MALTKKATNIAFEQYYKFTSNLKLLNRRNLRNLDKTLSEIDIICKIDNNLSLDKTGGYNCFSEGKKIHGLPSSLEIDINKIKDISGKEKINTLLEPNNNIDYSQKENLKNINGLPEVNIENINVNTCFQNGQYIIEGEISDTSKLESKYSNVEIIISNPETTDICEVDIDENKNELKLTSENREKFDISQIIMDKNLIQDSAGNNIFFINSFCTPDMFSYDISLSSLKNQIKYSEPILSSITTPTTTKIIIPTNKIATDMPEIHKSKNWGLSGGAITGIVIDSVVIPQELLF